MKDFNRLKELKKKASEDHLSVLQEKYKAVQNQNIITTDTIVNRVISF